MPAAIDPSKDMRLRFIFANHDGVSLELSMPPSIKISEVKKRLQKAWPAVLLVSTTHTQAHTHTQTTAQRASTSSTKKEKEEEEEEEEEESDMEEMDEEEDEEEEEVDDRATDISASASTLSPPDVSLIRLVCMGQGLLLDGKSLHDCHIPTFDTHPTPVNVSLRPSPKEPTNKGQGKRKKKTKTLEEGEREATAGGVVPATCGCSIM